MLERLVIALILIGISFVLYRLFVVFQLNRANNTLPGLEGRETGKYLILYFTSPTCQPCRSAQRPALQMAQKTFGEQLQVITVDITEQPDVAAAWRVMTLPTTYLFDTRGTSHNYNPGVAYADKLIMQIKNMGAEG